ncbi:MAG: alpha/beta hydrolase [Verrucomicrobiota bacterium]
MTKKLFLVLSLIFVSFGFLGWRLTSAVPRIIGVPPAELHALDVSISLPNQNYVSGWYLQGVEGHGAVLLLHGVRSNRLQMLGRAQFLNRLGYAVLLMDLPSHGKSTGSRITFGVRESLGVDASLKWLKETTGNEKIGVIGVSLGAASFVLSKSTGIPDAVVLESMYPTISNAISDRLMIRLGSWGRIFTPLFIFQLPFWTGVTSHDLCPEGRLSEVHCPIMIVSGSKDNHTTLAETMRLYEKASDPKTIWIVEGASHVDLYSFNPEVYESKIASFFEKYLRR